MIRPFLILEAGLRPDQVAERLQGWEILPIEVDGVTVGEIMAQGNEVHVALSSRCRRNYRAGMALLRMARKLLEQRKFLVTRLYKDDPNEAWARKLGFVKTHEDGAFNFYWMDAVAIERA